MLYRETQTLWDDGIHSPHGGIRGKGEHVQFPARIHGPIWATTRGSQRARYRPFRWCRPPRVYIILATHVLQTGAI